MFLLYATLNPGLVDVRCESYSPGLRLRYPGLRVWVHEMSRHEKGEFNLVKELRCQDERFQSYFRLDKNLFDVLLLSHWLYFERSAAFEVKLK